MHIEETRVDAPEAAELLTEYFRERAAGFPGGGYRVALPDPAAFIRPAGVFLVARDDGDGVGCAGIRDLGTDDQGRRRYELKHLYVRPTARGRGIGRGLVDRLEELAAALGADRLLLDTNSSLGEAAGLYGASGYTSVPPYNDNPNADTWLGKDLRPQRAADTD